MDLAALPRDLQVLVCRAECRLGGMDARIRAGLVFRLRVPADIAGKIGRALVKPLESSTFDGQGTLLRRITVVAFPSETTAAATPRFVLRQMYLTASSVRVYCRQILSFPPDGASAHMGVYPIWYRSLDDTRRAGAFSQAPDQC